MTHVQAQRAQLLQWLDGQRLTPEQAVRLLLPEVFGLSSCRQCGCSDWMSCDEGCWWVEPDLCSRCAVVGSGAQ